MEVNIIGKGPGWELAPHDGESWGVNDLCLRRNVSVVFDLHEQIETPIRKKIQNYISKTNVPLVTLDEFPLEKLHSHYCNNSISYMIAYAIEKGYIKINLYGIFCKRGSEYFYQKPSIEYWIGYARGKGITVNINEPTSILKTQNGMMYGYNIPQDKF